MRRLQTNYLKKRSIELRYYNRSVDMTQQAEDNYYKQEENNKVFSEQLEAQRHEIVETVEDINDIMVLVSPPEMKEYLLHDIMELNDNRDPIWRNYLEVLRLCLKPTGFKLR
jgi:preprotein translocase subunit Sss1